MACRALATASANRPSYTRYVIVVERLEQVRERFREREIVQTHTSSPALDGSREVVERRDHRIEGALHIRCADGVIFSTWNDEPVVGDTPFGTPGPSANHLLRNLEEGAKLMTPAIANAETVKPPI
jgi:hypothetical protein